MVGQKEATLYLGNHYPADGELFPGHTLVIDGHIVSSGRTRPFDTSRSFGSEIGEVCRDYGAKMPVISNGVEVDRETLEERCCDPVGQTFEHQIKMEIIAGYQASRYKKENKKSKIPDASIR